MCRKKCPKTRFTISHFPCATKRKPCLPASSSIPIPPAPLCPLHPSSSSRYLHPPRLLWDHGNCASSVAFHALPAALQKEACSNDLLHSSLAIIALTINSRLAFLCGGGGGGDVSVGSLIRAPCNVSGSSSQPATSALPPPPLLLLLYNVCFKDAFPCFFFSLPPEMTDTGFKSAPGLSLLPTLLSPLNQGFEE